MTLTELLKIVENRKQHIDRTLIAKNKEYANPEDVLKNFNDGANFTGLTPEKTLWAYLTKHLVSIKDLTENTDKATQDVLNEKIGDAINYMILLDAIFTEKLDKRN